MPKIENIDEEVTKLLDSISLKDGLDLDPMFYYQIDTVLECMKIEKTKENVIEILHAGVHFLLKAQMAKILRS